MLRETDTATVSALINTDAPDAQIGEELVVLRRSRPFSDVTGVDEAFAAMGDALGIKVEAIRAYRASFYAAAK
jgi:hypothetical protein